MSNPEQESSLPKPEFKLAVPSLPSLYEGVFEEVYTDYLSDPEIFKVSTMYRIEQDNPALTPFFSTEMIFDESDISVKWPFIYYEIFARSSKGDGLPPMRVTSQTVGTALKLASLDIGRAFDSSRARDEYLERLNERWEDRKRRDMEMSPELVRFWGVVDQDLEMQKEGGSEAEDLRMYLINLQKLQEILHRQHDEYSISGKYSSQS